MHHQQKSLFKEIKMPQLSIMLPAFKEEHVDYLNLTLDSLRNQYFTDFEVLIPHNHSKDPDTTGLNAKVMRPDPRLSVNEWYNIISKEAEGDLIMTTSDDLIFSRQSLHNMVSLCNSYGGIIHPISQNDVGLLYLAQFSVVNEELKRLNLKRYMRIDEVKGFVDSIKNFDTKFSTPFLFPVKWVCTFATMMRKSTWDLLKGFDTDTYKIGQIDVDFCLRAAKEKIMTYVTPNAFVFHFGGVSTDGNIPSEVKVRDMQAFKNRWDFVP